MKNSHDFFFSKCKSCYNSTKIVCDTERKYNMIFVLLILIILVLIAGVIFLVCKFGETLLEFGDAVLEMLAQLIDTPKEMIILLLFGLVLAAIGIKMVTRLLNGR